MQQITVISLSKVCFNRLVTLPNINSSKNLVSCEDLYVSMEDDTNTMMK